MRGRCADSVEARLNAAVIRRSTSLMRRNGLVRTAAVPLFPDGEGIAAGIGTLIRVAIAKTLGILRVAIAIVEPANVTAPRRSFAEARIGSGETQMVLQALDGEFDVVSLARAQRRQPMLEPPDLPAQVLRFVAADEAAVPENIDLKLDGSQA